MMQERKKKQTVMFLGTPDFAVPSLRALLESPGFEVILVITQPDKPVGRSQALTPPPIKQLAMKYDIPIFQPKNLNKEWDERPIKEKPDFLVVVAYGQILKQNILDEPLIAPVNVHASLLPRWRGASPIQHAILNGDTESGVTIQQMQLDLDSGPILAQSSVKLDARETQETLFKKLSTLGAGLLLSTLKEPLMLCEQKESEVTICKKLSREDGVVDPEKMTAEEIDRKVRALVPWPGVKATWSGQELKLLETSLTESKDAVAISCKDGSMLFVIKLQAPGKKPMTGAEWKRGLQN